MELIKELISLYMVYFRPVLDILLLAFLLFKGYEILVKTQAMQLVKGGIWILVVYSVAFALQLTTLLWLLNTLATGLVIGTAIIFQPELRKIFLTIGQNNWWRTRTLTGKEDISRIVDAAAYLASCRRGMLVVFARQDSLSDIMENQSATQLNAEISSNLLITIFEYDTPLHDGAVVIGGGKLIAAGCFLPLTEQQDINKAFGTRHRAALGIAEQTDAVVLIVSEESGALSLAYDSKLYYNLGREAVQNELKYLLSNKIQKNGEAGKGSEN